MPNKRSRTGCLTCRRDGYKCDEQRPLCQRCVRLGKTCTGYGPQLKWRQVNPTHHTRARASADTSTARPGRSPSPGAQLADVASSSMGRPATAKPCPHRQLMSYGTDMESWHWRGLGTTSHRLGLLPNDVPHLDRRLLHHWTTVLAGMVSMASGPTNNPFLTHLTPLIIESPTLRSAVLSMAASHLSLLHPDDTAISMASRRHRLAAVSSLRLMVGSTEAEVSLATILMLQLSDRLFIAADDSPADHLVGAKAVIEQSQDRWSTTTTKSFLLGIYLYQDVLASVTKGSSPLSELEDDIMVEGLASLAKLTAVLRIVGRISRMLEMDKALFPEHGALLHQMISSLEPPEPESCQSDIGQTADAYRHAAFIYLYRVAYNIGAPHHLTMHHVEACLRLISSVSTTSTMLSAHVWPLWTAGCESIDPVHRDFVRTRLDEMYQLRRLPSLQRVRGDIEEVWAVKDAQRESTGADQIDCIRAVWRTRRRTADLI